MSANILATNILFSDDVDAMEVRAASGERLHLQFLQGDPCLGLMFLKVKGRELQALPVAPARELRFGQEVHVACIPNLRGSKSQVSVVAGVVSGLHRVGVGTSQLEDYMQIDAVVPEGSAGAPVLDLEGRLVGIYAATAYMPIGYRSHRMSGINYANSSALIERALANAQSGSAPAWSWLGLQLDIDPVREGNDLVVQYVYPESTGFQPGDELLRIGEQKVDTIAYSVLQRTLAEQPVGSQVTVELRRHDKIVTVNPVLMSRPDWPQLAPLDAIHWVLGVRIGSPNGKDWAVETVSEWQAGNGILASDTVQLLNGDKIKSEEHLAAMVEESYGEHALSLSLTLRSRRAGKSHPTYTARAYHRFSNPSTL